MASTAATGQTYNNTNVIGEFLMTGYARTPLLDAIGFLNGARRVQSQEFAMSSVSSLDAGAQGAISETSSLTEGTANTYAKSLEYNTTQIMKYPVIISDLREAATQQLKDETIEIGGLADQGSEFDRQVMLSLAQMKQDFEWALIQGTYVGRSAVGTVVATGGLTDSTVGVSTSTVDASSAALSKDLIDELLIDMMDNGARFDDMAFIVKHTYLPQLSDIYGFQPQARDIGGVGVKTIVTDFGEIAIIGTKNAPANTLVAADLAWLRPAVLPHKGGEDILMKMYEDGGSAQKGYIEGYLGADFGSESYHGTITNLA